MDRRFIAEKIMTLIISLILSPSAMASKRLSGTGNHFLSKSMIYINIFILTVDLT